MDRIQQQMRFILEADRLKTVLRRNYISDGTRRENDAEHSWYFALAALVLAEHADGTVDVGKVLRMALIHDLVEIDAGDTFIYDEQAKAGQHEREAAAAGRIFGMLPPDQREYFSSLWNEFEEMRTPEAKFARAIDRVSAIMLNYATGGKAWREHGIGHAQVFEINRKIAEGSPAIWEYIRGIISEAKERGFLKSD